MCVRRSPLIPLAALLRSRRRFARILPDRRRTWPRDCRDDLLPPRCIPEVKRSAPAAARTAGAGTRSSVPPLAWQCFWTGGSSACLYRFRRSDYLAKTKLASPDLAAAPVTDRSWNASDSERAQRAAHVLRCEFLFLLLVRHEQAAALHIESEIVHVQHAHAEAHLGANRIQLRIKRFLGDAEVSQPHRHDPVLAPNEQRQRRDDRSNLQRARLRPPVVGLQLRARRITDDFERSEQRMHSNFRLRRAARFKLSRIFNFRIEFDRLNRRPRQA